MNAGWVAGSVRAQAMARRRLGLSGVRELAHSADQVQVMRLLAASAYGGRLSPSADLAEAQRAVLETLLWNLRVLAGWLPAPGVRALRILAGWFEIANVDEHIAGLAGQRTEPAFRLGVLGSAWLRLARTQSLPELRTALAASVWGDPGGATAYDIGLSMRAVWAERVAEHVVQAREWALGGAALLAAGQVGSGRPLPDRAARSLRVILGRHWAEVGDLAGWAERLPVRARWVLHGVDGPERLWRAEAAWWSRLREDGLRLMSGGFGPDRPIGAVALLAADAWQVRAALAAAARPDMAEEDRDAVA